jgi:hypothetical protein
MKPSLISMRNTPMRHSILFVVTCAVSLAAMAPNVLAADGKEPTAAEVDEAKRRYQRGRELYDDNDLRGALVEIRRAYDLAPNYKLLFDIGQICYQLPDYPCALATFKKYLAEGGDGVAEDVRATVQKDITKLEGRVATLKVTTNRPGAEILVDDVVVGTTPLTQPVVVGAGKRKIVARISGAEPVTKTLDVAGQDVLDVPLEFGAVVSDVKPPPIADKPPPTKPVQETKAGSGVPVVPWVITGVLAVGTGIAGGLAMSASSDYRSKLDTFGTTRAQLDDGLSSVQSRALATDILLGLTVAGAATSIVLTVMSKPKAPVNKGAMAPLTASVGPGSVWISGKF